MDWQYLSDEILELLDSFGCHEGNVTSIDRLVSNFVSRIQDKYNPETEEDDESEELSIALNW